MQLGLKGKRVLVTAGSQGLGLACAKGFAEEGADVAICGRTQSALDAAAQQIDGLRTFVADVSKPADIEALMDAVGDIDILVANAGGPPPGPFDALSEADWKAAFDLTMMSAVRLAARALPAMRAQKWGRVLIISSYGVKQPVPGLSLSNTMRMGVLGWAKTLASQVAGDNVLVNTLCPGWTATDRVTSLLTQKAETDGNALADQEADIAAQVPLGRLGQPHELANLAVFLGSEAASYITGSAIAVDGGLVAGY
ncbi:MAG: SDR family oxidoreductase [Pseudomonadota bacterium]